MSNERQARENARVPVSAGKCAASGKRGKTLTGGKGEKSYFSQVR